MEVADTTLENLVCERRELVVGSSDHGQGGLVSGKVLKRVGVALLHLHEKGLVHMDFGAHNVGKFRNRWKVLGIGGSITIRGL